LALDKLVVEKSVGFQVLGVLVTIRLLDFGPKALSVWLLSRLECNAGVAGMIELEWQDGDGSSLLSTLSPGKGLSFFLRFDEALVDDVLSNFLVFKLPFTRDEDAEERFSKSDCFSVEEPDGGRAVV
jgi:hypothetical protein